MYEVAFFALNLAVDRYVFIRADWSAFSCVNAAMIKVVHDRFTHLSISSRSAKISIISAEPSMKLFVCINKVTCIRMYNFVQEYWKTKIDKTEKMLKNASQQEAQEINRKLQWLRETEMYVVISQEQNEIQTFNKWELDIKPHRKKMEKRELDREFKDSKNPFRVVFVCAMWLTGFDVKSLSCLYLDKPLTAHTLMQAIASTISFLRVCANTQV